MRRYTVVFEKSATGWCAYYPDVPGLASCSPTLEETRRLTKEGLHAHLQAMIDDGDTLPAARHIGATMLFEVPEPEQSGASLAMRAA